MQGELVVEFLRKEAIKHKIREARKVESDYYGFMKTDVRIKRMANERKRKVK